MNVYQLIEELKLASGITDVVIQYQGGKGQLVQEPLVAIDSTSPHEGPTILSSVEIEVQVLPPPAPLDPGYPGQLSPPPPHFVPTAEEEGVDEADEDEPRHSPLRPRKR
jgi:hypothetical protein